MASRREKGKSMKLYADEFKTTIHDSQQAMGRERNNVADLLGALVPFDPNGADKLGLPEPTIKVLKSVCELITTTVEFEHRADRYQNYDNERVVKAFLDLEVGIKACTENLKGSIPYVKQARDIYDGWKPGPSRHPADRAEEAVPPMLSMKRCL